MEIPPVAMSAGGSEINWLFETSKILLTAGLTILGTGIFVNLWQLREKYIEERISELIKQVDAAANLATEYWLLSKKARGRKFREIVLHDSVKDAALEAELVAHVHRIGRMRASVGEFLNNKDMQDLLIEEGELNAAFTGGDFRSPNRICEPDRFILIRTHAASYIACLLKARRARQSQPWYKRVFG